MFTPLEFVNFPRIELFCFQIDSGNLKIFVGADAHIGPEANGMGMSVFSGRSGVVPHGAMRASPPTLKTNVDFVGIAPNAENARCFYVGADAHIAPWLAVQPCPYFLTAPETHPTGR